VANIEGASDALLLHPLPISNFGSEREIDMKTLANLLTSIVVAFWVVAIAILSVQNVTPVTLKFLRLESIQIPVGLVLAFSAGVGIIGMALLQPLWGLAGSRQSNYQSEDDTEFFVDDEN